MLVPFISREEEKRLRDGGWGKLLQKNTRLNSRFFFFLFFSAEEMEKFLFLNIVGRHRQQLFGGICNEAFNTFVGIKHVLIRFFVASGIERLHWIFSREASHVRFDLFWLSIKWEIVSKKSWKILLERNSWKFSIRVFQALISFFLDSINFIEYLQLSKKKVKICSVKIFYRVCNKNRKKNSLEIAYKFFTARNHLGKFKLFSWLCGENTKESSPWIPCGNLTLVLFSESLLLLPFWAYESKLIKYMLFLRKDTHVKMNNPKLVRTK